jgi:type I restriction enzyme S subunit
MKETQSISNSNQIKKLGEVCTYSKGKKPAILKETKTKECSIPYINIKAFEKGIISEYTNGEKCNICEDDDLLMVWDGARCGLIGKAKKGAVGSTLMKILPKENIHKEYLYHFISSKFWTLNTKPKGVGIPHIEPTLLWNFELVVPPLPEQHAIVSKIEQLLSELENGKQQLLTAQQQLKVYRQSLLKWAFEGKLTNTNVKEGELPKGWKIVKLSELGTWKGGGTPSKQISKYWENGSNLWVTSKDMKIGVINDSINKITDEAILNSSANRIPKGAILFVMRSGILRHTFPVAIAGKDLTVNQDLQTLSPNGLATSEFIYWFIRAFNNDIRQKCSKDGTTVESIESSSLKNYPFILPPLQEQQQIVSELESKLTVCDKIEETISQSLQQAETLRQSILKKAFEGSLITTVDEQREAKVIPLYKPKNEYFYQMQLLGIVAKTSKQKQIEHGEMTLAKYAYLIDKVYDVPTYFNYNRWHLGPYPPTIKKVINNKQYFKKSGNHIEVLNEKTLFNSTNPNTAKMQSAVNDLTDIFSKYNTKERSHKTELLATVCKVIEDIQSTNLKAIRQSMAEWKINLKDEKDKTKAEKFNEAETEKCLAFIKEKGWDKKLMK